MNHLNRTKKFLLPTSSSWDATISAIAGVWSQMSDPGAQDAFRNLIAQNVIKDEVLSQARNGSVLTFALFHNLRNPLFTKCNFDVKEFCGVVGPALEVFQDTLGQLVHEMNQEPTESTLDTKSDEEPIQQLLSNTTSMFDTLAGENLWKKQAKEDPESLAGQLAKMTTDDNFDAHYFGAKLFRALAFGSGGSSMEYVTGSGKVGQVALLDARAMAVDLTKSDQIKHPEFAASDTFDAKESVAARFDVLYEITQSFRKTPDPLSASEQYKSMDASQSTEVHESVDTSSTSTVTVDPEGISASEEKPVDAVTEKNTVTETSLAVAVIEGWLHGGPDKKLRWKVAMIRDVHEFS